jgi:hypothetical protein
VIAAAIPDAMLLLTDEWLAQEVPEHAYDGITCPKYALVFSTTWLECKDMTQDPLVEREPISASCNRRRMRVWRHKNTAYTQGTSSLLSLAEVQ